LPTPDMPSRVTFLLFQARNSSMLNFTAVAPGGVKALDYAGIKPYRPDTAGRTRGCIEFVRDAMRAAAADLHRLMEL
jgi:hypothetical protein